MSKRAVGETAGHELPAGFVAGESAGGEPQAENLLEQLIQGTLAVEDGTLLFDRMVNHIRSLLLVPSFGSAAVREMVSAVVAERFAGGVWVHVNREQLLDWLVERMMSSPAAEQGLRELWGSVCRQIPELKN